MSGRGCSRVLRGGWEREVAGLVSSAMGEELAAYPKPGLVSLVDSGSHPDMDAGCFQVSIEVLEPFFFRLVEAGAGGAEFGVLQRIGVEAEVAMLAATGGRNTHRGAIFCLGLLAAAAGRQMVCGEGRESLGEVVAGTWGRSLMECGRGREESHGARMCGKYGVGGAREEAGRGFPSVFETGLPSFRKSLVAGREAARIQVFYELLARCQDTTLLKRGGRRGASFARGRCVRFLGNGGVFREGWKEEAEEIHGEFVARNLTAGGVADLLAATIFVHEWEAWFC